MQRPNTGFSLIELMIAVTLGMLAVAAVGSVFIYGSRNYKQDDKISRTQDELRFAMAQLTQDLEMAGFWAQINGPEGSNVTIDASATTAVDCGPPPAGGVSTFANNWVYRERRASITTRGNASAAQANETFPCIAANAFVAGTDIIAIKRLGDAFTPNNADIGRILLRTNGVQSTIYRHSASPPGPTGANVTVYPYHVSVWYIRNFTNEGENPRIPALCRMVLRRGDPPTMGADGDGCIAQGIEDMQLEFGLDSAVNPDGIANTFVEYDAAVVPGPDVLRRVVAVRVHLLARSSQSDAASGYKNVKSYTLAGKSIPAANDGFYRKTMSTVVLLRNPANRLNPFALPNS